MTSHEIILFHYEFSPFSKRVIYYLNLRNIPYSECTQPHMLPRPDLSSLGVSYRRIPILSIGRDIYVDSRLILQKLDELYPASAQHPDIRATKAEHKALEKLIDYWIIDGGVFSRCAQLIPVESPMVRDEKFLEDRRQMIGGGFTIEMLTAVKPEAKVEMRNWFEFLETSILGDGREWVLGSEGPMRADIEVAWPFVWLRALPGALPPNIISSKLFPKVYSYLDRFENHISTLLPKLTITTLSGPQVLSKFEDSTFTYAEQEIGIEDNDPAGFKKGELVDVWPIDSGFNNKDRGKLVGLSWAEVVVESRTRGGKDVRIHAPRHGFRIGRVDGSKL